MIEPTPDGVIIAIRVIPRAGRTGVAGTRGNALLVRLAAPPIAGAANAELIELLTDLLDVPRRSITIVSGERSRQKRVKVTGVTAAFVESKVR